MEYNYTNNPTESIEYQQLITDLQELQDNRRKLDTYIEFLTNSFSELENYLQNWDLKYDLDAIVEDVNGVLGDPAVSDDVMVLQKRLQDIKSEIETLENALKDLVQVYTELRMKPDRHGKVEAIQKTESFLASLRQLHIGQIRHTVGTTIPDLTRDMQAVLEAFKSENNKQLANMNLASQLLDRIKEFLGYADKFNAVNICRACEPKVKEVMQNPSVDPDIDAKTLQNVQQELDALRAAFDNEKQQFLDFEASLSKHLETIWAEDYEYFTQIFNGDSCKMSNTIEELRLSYERYSDNKVDDIDKVKLIYSDRKFPRTKIIMERFNSNFQQLRDSFSSKSDLDKLICDIEEYIKARRKEIAKKIWEIIKTIFKIIIFPIVLIGKIIGGIIKLFSKD